MQTQVKIHILIEFKSGPWGGGNQFLKGLREKLIEKEVYSDRPENSNVAIFNSHHNIKNVIKYKIKYPDKLLIHRVDGPMSYRGDKGKKLDRKIFQINSKISDGTVFQSNWSKEENIINGMEVGSKSIVINNAPDPKIFFPSKQKNNKKIKLISTSWSNNLDKGFDIYHFIDQNLDFDRYDMSFIGRTDKSFENISFIDPLPSKILADKIRDHDIFIFASKIEACSNSLLEAIHCGLPAVARNTSSNPEVLRGNGEIFNDEKDVIEKINLVSSKLNDYKKNLNYETMDTIADKYIDYCKSFLSSKKYNKKPPIGLIDRIKLGRTLI